MHHEAFLITNHYLSIIGHIIDHRTKVITTHLYSCSIQLNDTKAAHCLYFICSFRTRIIISSANIGKKQAQFLLSCHQRTTPITKNKNRAITKGLHRRRSWLLRWVAHSSVTNCWGIIRTVVCSFPTAHQQQWRTSPCSFAQCKHARRFLAMFINSYHQYCSECVYTSSRV